MKDHRKPLLSIRDLSVRFATHQGLARVLEKVCLDIKSGEILGLVGETGCGKSVLARSVLRIIPSPPGEIASGTIFYQEEDLLQISDKRMRQVRGNRISMIFQEPMSSMNPVFSVGNQMREVIRLHQRVSSREANRIALDMLRQVQMPDPAAVLGKFPHELSGGMRQRVMIAMELSCGPDLLLADEPSTALDVTVQGQVLAILQRLAWEKGVSVLFITHDMGVVAQICDRVAVMYAGQMVEVAEVRELFSSPAHPYTRGLISAIPGTGGGNGTEHLYSIPGVVPGLIDPPGGCRYHPRCEKMKAICAEQTPAMVELHADHAVACHFCSPSSEEGRK